MALASAENIELVDEDLRRSQENVLIKLYMQYQRLVPGRMKLILKFAGKLLLGRAAPCIGPAISFLEALVEFYNGNRAGAVTNAIIGIFDLYSFGICSAAHQAATPASNIMLKCAEKIGLTIPASNIVLRCSNVTTKVTGMKYIKALIGNVRQSAKYVCKELKDVLSTWMPTVVEGVKGVMESGFTNLESILINVAEKISPSIVAELLKKLPIRLNFIAPQTGLILCKECEKTASAVSFGKSFVVGIINFASSCCIPSLPKNFHFPTFYFN